MKGRGALSNPAARYLPQSTHYESEYDPRFKARVETRVMEVQARSIIATNRSPDVPFDQSINMYRGCEHGCIYCFARPTHAYLDLSPGLDFETQLIAKVNAAQLLRKELSRKSYQCRTIALGTNTDPYQPVDNKYRLTREILKVLLEVRHPVTVLTKGQGVIRDLDILSELAQLGLTRVSVSLPTLDRSLKRTLEPRAAGVDSRLRIIERLSQAGIPTGVMLAPIIPKVNDEDLESVLEKAAGAGATSAGYVILRLPLEVKPLFEQWLAEHLPLRAQAVMRQVTDMHGGKAYDATWGKRQSGEGFFAQMIGNRFRAACRRFGLNEKERDDLRTDLFLPPQPSGQMLLF